MKKIILSTLLVFGALICHAQSLHFKVFAINRAVYSPEFQKYMFDENLPSTGDIYVTNNKGFEQVHVYTANNQHIRFTIVRELYDNYNRGDRQLGYSCLDPGGSKVTVKFIFKDEHVEVYFFFDTMGIVYSTTPMGRQ